MSSKPLIAEETRELLGWSRLCEHLASFAQTKAGKRACESLLPVTRAEAETALERVGEVRWLASTALDSLSLAGVEDIEAAIERSERGGTLEGEVLIAVASTLSVARRVRRVIEERSENLPYLAELVTDLRTFPELEQEIYRCIEDTGEVADRASERLAKLRGGHKRLRDEIQRTLLGLLQRRGVCFQEHFITQRGDRYVLPVKVSYKDQVPGIVHDASASGQTLYIEPMSVIDTTNRLRAGLAEERAEVERILGVLSARLAEHAPELHHLHRVLVTLDLAASRARYADWLGAVRPEFGSECLVLQARHPLLVWQARHEQGGAVVPIDLPVTTQTRVVVITGPNTGGKTVTLKTLGLVVLMAQAGMYVPAHTARLPWFDEVLADIGDEQSLEQSLSTFSGHIRRITRILEEASSQSLVLLDEVGAGTDPQEGTALAEALLEHLALQARLTLATTHYGQLKALKYTHEDFENASAEFDVETLAPTYRLLWGIPGRSNALTIAERLGLDSAVVARARAGLNQDSVEINNVISGLETQLRLQEQQTRQAEHLRREVERLQTELLRQRAHLDRREAELYEHRDREVRAAIEQARTEVARVIRTLQRGPTAQQAQQASAELEVLGGAYLQPRPPEPDEPPRVKAGDKVEIIPLAQTGEVISGPDGTDQVVVRVGVLKLTVPLTQLRLPGMAVKQKAARPPEPPRPQPSAPPPPLVRTESQTIDLRGKRVSEAEALLQPELDRQRGPLWVIHGHGTGKLREGVHQILERHPRVAHFEFAERSDGGNGVTVVFLK